MAFSLKVFIIRTMIMISTTETPTMKNFLGEKSEPTNLFGLLAPFLLSSHLRFYISLIYHHDGHNVSFLLPPYLNQIMTMTHNINHNVRGMTTLFLDDTIS